MKGWVGFYIYGSVGWKIFNPTRLDLIEIILQPNPIDTFLICQLSYCKNIVLAFLLIIMVQVVWALGAWNSRQNLYCFLTELVSISFSKKKKKKKERKKIQHINLEKWYVYNISTTFLQQILNGKLLLVVIVGAKK